MNHKRAHCSSSKVPESKTKAHLENPEPQKKIRTQKDIDDDYERLQARIRARNQKSESQGIQENQNPGKDSGKNLERIHRDGEDSEGVRKVAENQSLVFWWMADAMENDMNKNLKSEENGCPSYFRSILKTMGKMTPEEEAAVMEVTGFWMCTIKNKEWERPVEMEIDGNVMERVKEKLNPLILATAPKIYAIICELVDKWEKKFEATVDSETVQYLASSAGFYYGFDYNRVEEIRDFLRDSEVV